MFKERAHLNLADEDELDLSEFTPTQSKKQDIIDTKKIEEVAERSGFISRARKSRRRKIQESPYKNQLNLKCRDGMKELFQAIGDRLVVHDHTTFELAILALIEKEDYKDLFQSYNEIKKLSNAKIG